MIISTKGRYALRVMTELASRQPGVFVPLKEIAEQQEISQKYLEGIMANLSRAGFVEGAHGKGGGYRLCRAPEDYRLGDILRLTEGSLAPVACLEDGTPHCSRAGGCRTLPVWTKLDGMIRDYLNSVTLADLLTPEERGE